MSARDPERSAWFRLVLGGLVLVSLVFAPHIDEIFDAYLKTQEQTQERHDRAR